jgi:hypothetical protein
MPKQRNSPLVLRADAKLSIDHGKEEQRSTEVSRTRKRIKSSKELSNAVKYIQSAGDNKKNLRGKATMDFINAGKEVDKFNKRRRVVPK